MSILTLKQLSAIQKIGEMTFAIVVDIYKRAPLAFDDSNPYGDDTVTYAAIATRVKGWLVPEPGVDFTTDVSQIISSGRAALRIPVGTDVEPGDKLRISGHDYFCSESTSEQTWPEWLIVRLRRIQ